MFEIIIKTHEGDKQSIKVIDKKYMGFIVKRFRECLDCSNILVTDGLTGEVLWDWQYDSGSFGKAEFSYLNALAYEGAAPGRKRGRENFS